MSEHVMTFLPGDHVCGIVGSAAEKADQTASWVNDGLMASERIIYVDAIRHTDGLLRSLERRGVGWRGAAQEGQLLIMNPDDAYRGDRGSYLGHRSSDIETVVEESLAAGYSAIRVSGDASAALEVVPDRAALMRYEERLEELCSSNLMSAMCFYDRHQFGAGLPHWAALHVGLADCGVQAMVGPGRLVISGELDASNVELVATTLRKVSPQAGELVVDLGGLSFIDVAGVRQLVKLARRVRAAGRVKVSGATATLRRIVDVAGWGAELDLGSESSVGELREGAPSLV